MAISTAGYRDPRNAFATTPTSCASTVAPKLVGPKEAAMSPSAKAITSANTKPMITNTTSIAEHRHQPPRVSVQLNLMDATAPASSITSAKYDRKIRPSRKNTNMNTRANIRIGITEDFAPPIPAVAMPPTMAAKIPNATAITIAHKKNTSSCSSTRGNKRNPDVKEVCTDGALFVETP